MQPGIFIGIGGTGMKTLAQLKAKIRSQYKSNEEMYENNHFIFLDTDHKTYEMVQSDPTLINSFNGRPPIDINELIYLGETNPARKYTAILNSKDNPDSKRFLEWVIPQNIPEGFELRDAQLQDGAGAARMAGRTTIYDNYFRIANAIDQGINKMQTILQQRAPLTNLDNLSDENKKIAKAENEAKLEQVKPSIWVIASSNGGTGSSSILDTLYIADRCYQHRFQSSPYLRLVLFMPEPFINSNPDNINYPLNAFSTFWELNAFRLDSKNDNDGKKFKYFSVKPDRDEWSAIDGRWDVYRYMIPVDIETDSSRKLDSFDKLFVTTAEMCFYLHLGAVGGGAVSRLDNDINDPQYQRPLTDVRTPFRWTRSLVATGYKALVKPEEEFREYIQTRFLYELFDYGLLGLDYADVHTSQNEQTEAKEEFGNKYILSLLESSHNLTSDYNLENLYEEDYKRLKFPAEPEKKTMGGYKSEDLPRIWRNFKDMVNKKAEELTGDFSGNGELSKSKIIELIKVRIKKGTEDCILKYGLKYAWHLLFLVDDKYCETLNERYRERLRDEYSDEKESQFDSKANNLIGKKSYDGLKKLGEDYRVFIKNKELLKRFIEIHDAVTKSNEGFLEVLRSGTGNKGINSLISNAEAIKNDYKQQLYELAKKFNASRTDVFTTYLPDLAGFVGSGEKSESSWVDNHLFEQLYGKIVLLDTGRNAIRLGNADLGTPPVRRTGADQGAERTLTVLLGEMLIGISEFFTNIALQEELGTGKKHDLNEFEKIAKDFILKKMQQVEEVNNWISKPLEEIFNDSFRNERDVAQFAGKFMQSIPVLFPKNTGAEKAGSVRYLFSGTSKALAVKLGFINVVGGDHEFLEETKLQNRMVVFKIEVGLNLFDYKYFGRLQASYNSNKNDIINLKNGCHIHKDFTLLDLNKAVERVNGNPNILKNLVEMCYYDEFFKHLFETQNNLYGLVFNLDQPRSSNSLEKMLGLSETDDNDSKHPSIFQVSKSGTTFMIELCRINNSASKLNIREKVTLNLNNVNSLNDFQNELRKMDNIFLDVINTIKAKVNELTTDFKTRVFSIISENKKTILTGVGQKLKQIIDIDSGTAMDNTIKADMERIISDLQSSNIFI